MPVHKVYNKSGEVMGYQWGRTGKIYRTEKEAQEQAKAIYASGYREKKQK